MLFDSIVSRKAKFVVTSYCFVDLNHEEGDGEAQRGYVYIGTGSSGSAEGSVEGFLVQDEKKDQRKLGQRTLSPRACSWQLLVIISLSSSKL
jgi:hypothetical protein